MVAAGQQTDFIASLLQDGAKFLRIADDVNFLMNQMKTISNCMYALTAGVYIAIVVYVLVVCYKDRRRHNTWDEGNTAAGYGGPGYQTSNHHPSQTGIHGTNNSMPDLELGNDPLGLGPDSSEQEMLPSSLSTGGTAVAQKSKMGARIRGAYSRRQYNNTSADRGSDGQQSKVSTTSGRLASGQGSRRTNTRFRDVVQAAQDAHGTQSNRGNSPLPLPPSSGHHEFDPSAALTVV